MDCSLDLRFGKVKNNLIPLVFASLRFASLGRTDVSGRRSRAPLKRRGRGCGMERCARGEC